jgi:hypothetical protein
MFAHPVSALHATIALASAASLVESAEAIWAGVRSRDGVFWQTCRAGILERSARLSNEHATTMVDTGVIVLLSTRALCAALTLAAVFAQGRYLEPLILLTLTALVASHWRIVGGDGASQMATIVLMAASTALLVTGDEASAAPPVLWFVGFQGILAYFVAGIAKAASAEWRNEDVVLKVVSTVAYGNAFIVRVLRRLPGLGRLLTLSVIGFELAMPLALAVPPEITLVFLAGALFFHVSCAFVMGLNDFVWAFSATYPGILYLASVFH